MRAIARWFRKHWHHSYPLEIAPPVYDPARTFVPHDHPQAFFHDIARWG